MVLPEKLARGLKATFLSRVVHIVANGLLIFLLARYLLEPGEYGLLFLTISILTIAQLFADLGVARSAARYLVEFKESDPAQVPHVVETALLFKLGLIGVVVTALFLGRGAIAAVLDEPTLLVLLLVGVVYLAVQSMQKFTYTLFQGFNVVEYSAAVFLTQDLSRVIAVVFFVGIGWGVTGALVGYTVSAALAAGTGLVILYVRFYRSYDAADRPTSGLRRRLAEYSVPLMVTHGAGVLNKQVDILLIGFFLNPVAVAVYTLAKQIAEFVEVPANSLGFTISPTYGEHRANEHLDQAARVYEKTVRYILLLYVPAVVGLIFVAQPGVPIIFGEQYADSVPVVQILGLFVLFVAVNHVTTQAIDYLGRARYRAIVKGTMALANVLLNILLIPTIGIVGAAIATVVTFGVYTIANVYIMYRELPIQFGRILPSVAGTAGISLVMGAGVLLLRPFISGFVSLIGVILFGVTVWAVLAVASGLLNIKDTKAFLL